MKKFIPLKPIFGMQLSASIIGFMFIILALVSYFLNPTESIKAELIYFFIGIVSVAISMQNVIFKDKKYIKITDNFIAIKKWILTPEIKIRISDITNVRIVGSRFAIKYADTQELINLDWISGYSRTLFANELQKLSEANNFPFEQINILDRFKNKEL